MSDTLRPQELEKFKVPLYGVKYVQLVEKQKNGAWHCLLFYHDYKLKPQQWSIEERLLGESYNEPSETT